jgi:hydroxymethylpyrimidine/phosphomethylpyrimidine kinase
MFMKRVLTIAGSDSGGGAGIQADLKTFMAFGVYGMSAITALTAQNTIGVQGIFEIPPDFIYQQIRSVMTDIGADAVKTGMLASAEIVATVSRAVNDFRISNLVVDPVMVAKSGDALLTETAQRSIWESLIPQALVITPNIFEAEVLLKREIKNLDDMYEAARDLKKSGCQWVVLKGGHLTIEEQAIDVAFDGQNFHLLKSPRLDSRHTHGTGCTFASAIAAGLAKGYEVLEAIRQAKKYITRAIKEGLPLGSGHGPTNHLAGTKTNW